MFQLFKKPSYQELADENMELKKQLSKLETKQKCMELKKERDKQGIGAFFNQEYIPNILEYIHKHNLETITLVSTVEPIKGAKADEIFNGIWYGIKVMNDKAEVVKIPITLETDSCFVSETAMKRRNKNLFLVIKLSEYLKTALEYEQIIMSNSAEVKLQEEIKVPKALFEATL